MEIRILCVGKMKERYFIEAASEYLKRLSPYVKVVVIEYPESPIGKDASPAQIEAALEREYAAMQIPVGAPLVTLCIEGELISSVELARRIGDYAVYGHSKLTFVIGGSNGLSPALKARSDLRLSFSKMTFPHHLARVLLLEQLYRVFTLLEGGRYHK